MIKVFFCLCVCPNAQLIIRESLLGLVGNVSPLNLHQDDQLVNYNLPAVFAGSSTFGEENTEGTIYVYYMAEPYSGTSKELRELF